jgi:hypothetical protein
MYAKTGISTDSARKKKANWMARLIARPCRLLFQAKPMPDLMIPCAAANRPAAIPETVTF